MSETQAWDRNVLKNMQTVFEGQGFKFYLNPSRDLVPDFLEDFEPSAIALSSDGGIIIEVKHRRSPASEKRLAAIAKKISAHKGWEIRVIYLNPPEDETPPIKNPTPEQLENTFRDIDGLAKTGHFAAALVTAWAALEALARLAGAYNGAERPESFSPMQAVQRLAEEGYVEHEVADHLREMIKLRNAVVHGDLSAKVPAGQVERLLKELRAIAAAIADVKPAHNV